MVITLDPRLINPFKNFIEAGGLEDACKGIEELGNLSRDIFEGALSEKKVFPYSSLALDIVTSLVKNSNAIVKNQNEFFAIALNGVIYPIKIDKIDIEKFSKIVGNVGPRIRSYSSKFFRLEKKLMDEIRIKSARGDEFAEFFPMRKASVIVYEQDQAGKHWFNNLVLRGEACRCKTGHLIAEYETPVSKFETYREAFQDAIKDKEIKSVGICKSVWQYPFRETGIQLVRRGYDKLLNEGLGIIKDSFLYYL